jgi:hypothetical protein
MQCPHCQQEHMDQASFCPVTGKPIKSSRTCPHCGKEVEATWVICGYCGEPIDTRTAPPAQRSQKTFQSLIPSSLPKPLFWGGLGILGGGLIFLALIGLMCIISIGTSIFDDKPPSTNYSATPKHENNTPPYYGAFLKQGSSLVELPELELFGAPKTYDVNQREVIKDNQPIVLLWHPNTRLDYLVLYSVTGREEIRFNSTPKEGGILELRPAQALDSGIYCYVQGDPMAAFLPGWCFEVQ